MMVVRTMSWQEKVGRCLFLFCCLTCALAGALLAQTSPKGTFRIETDIRLDEDPTAGAHEQQFVVSMADSKVREPLGEEDQPATYFISPDEQSIFAQVHYGSGMGGARLYQRKKDLKFERVMDEKPIWKFFEKQALKGKKRPSDWGVEIIDFVGWSPDSARVLFSLRTGKRVTGEGSFGYYDWRAYYNVRSGKFEVTDYWRALNRSARKLRPEDDYKKLVATTASAEPLAELPPESDINGYLIPPPEQAWDRFAGIWRGDTAADVKKLFGEPLLKETNAGQELRYFDGALVVTCDKQTQRVRSVCLDRSTESFRTQWRAASAKRHLYELQWASFSKNYESLRKVFGPKLEKHSTERGETFDYAYSPRTTISCHPDLQDGNCSAICVLWNE